MAIRLLQSLFVLALLAFGPAAKAEEKVVHIYNWNDYFAEDTLEQFESATGIKPVLDLYDANEVLEAKLLAGSSGYDVVFPTARPFAARHIAADIYLPLQRERLTGWSNLDAKVLESLQDVDPGNRFLVPYMWGTSGLGVNEAKVRAILGEDADLESWSLLFDPDKAERLAACGITLLDDPEVLGAVLSYLGRDPNSVKSEDLEAARAQLAKVRPHIRYFHSSQYINDLANGDICVAYGYSGDVLQAADRAEEAGNGVELSYLIPTEGAPVWTDVMAIPKDAPHPQAAHAFIDFLLRPEVIAEVSNYVYYANANSAADPFLDDELSEDPGIYPGEEVRQRLYVPAQRNERDLRNLNRLWTRIKADR